MFRLIIRMGTISIVQLKIEIKSINQNRIPLVKPNEIIEHINPIKSRTIPANFESTILDCNQLSKNEELLTIVLLDVL
ncbi:hypothetical protein T190820D02B_60082 [Tenacibaculum sp. 190524A05c]